MERKGGKGGREGGREREGEDQGDTEATNILFTCSFSK